MTDEQLRLECLKLSRPDVSNPDKDVWIEKAKALEVYVRGEGQGEEPPKKRRGRPPKVRSDNPVPTGPDAEQLSI